MICPCGTKANYSACCGRFHDGHALPKTATELMRSRYAAFAKGRIDYLKATTWPKFQHDFDHAAYASRAQNSTWLGLDIIQSEQGEAEATTGTVTFSANSLYQGRFNQQREKSRFRKKAGRWYYVGPEAE